MTSQYATLWSFWHLLQKNEELELKYGYQHFRALTIARDPQRLPKLKAQAQSVYRNDPYGPLIF
jgi:hypothetical protein